MSTTPRDRPLQNYLTAMAIPKRLATSNDTFSYTWEEVATKLGLASTKEIPNFVLGADFLEPWVHFRDLLPLRPGIAVPEIATAEQITRSYETMDSMAFCVYDRPSPEDAKTWSPSQWLECLVYQSARNLAREGRAFVIPFCRTSLKNYAGRQEACNRLRGLMMLSLNLCDNYTAMAPSNLVKRIEAAKPTKDPNFSPIPEIRIKWQLDHMGVDELRKRVIDSERKGQAEKEWLISILMGKDGAPVTAMDKSSKSMASQGLLTKKGDAVELVGSRKVSEVAVVKESLGTKKVGGEGIAGKKRAGAGLREEEAAKKTKGLP